MARSWYVLHTYSGYENKVERHIRAMMADEPLKESVFDVKVPSEEVVEMKDGKKKVTNKKFLPGYILVEMDLKLDWKAVCSKIRKINGVTGFIGHSSSTKPQPISMDEARGILQKTGELKSERGYFSRQSFTEGESVQIIGGPFESFTGVIENVNTEKGKLRVSVGIFGRSTPVEVDFTQVEKK